MENKYWQGYEKVGTFVYCSWECNVVLCNVEISLGFSQKISIDLPYDPLLGIYSEELKMSIQTNACTWMFIITLFTIGKRYKQAKCSLPDEWISKMVVCPYYGILFSH